MVKSYVKRIVFFLELFGISIVKFFNSIRGLKFYIIDYCKIKKALKKSKTELKITKLYPCLDDRFSESGIGVGHYFKQDLYVAQKIFLRNPEKHVDIGSRIDGFVAHVATFREIEVYDIRPLENSITNVKFLRGNFMDENFVIKDYCDSISSLHVLEHFGLGRYGDPITVDGHIKGFNNIYNMLLKGGIFYFSIPIGPTRIEFNAHRVFSLKYLLTIIKPKYKIISFSYIDDNNNFYENVELLMTNINNNFNCKYGCGIFELEKL